MSRLQYEPMPRKRPSAAVVVLTICLIGLALSVALLFWIYATSGADLPDEAPAPEDMREVEDTSIGSIVMRDGTVMHLYVFPDPETGVEWLVNDRGGMEARVDTMGRVMVDAGA